MPGGGKSEIVQQPCSRLPTCMYAPPSQQWFSAAHTGLKCFKPAMIFGRKSRGPPAFYSVYVVGMFENKTLRLCSRS